MLVTFLCLDWLAPAHPASTLKRSDIDELYPASERQNCLDKLAGCLGLFDGVVGVLATKQMAGRRLVDVGQGLGKLQNLIFDSVNTTAESAYEFVSDYLRTWQGEWVAIASSEHSFPAEYRDRVVVFSGDASEMDAACDCLRTLITSAGFACLTPPTAGELFRIASDKLMVASMKAHLAASMGK